MQKGFAGFLFAIMFFLPTFALADTHLVSTSAFSGTIPTSYTDLDLSSIVGANSAVVMLKIVITSQNGNPNIRFITKGDTGSSNSTGGTNNLFKASASTADYILVKTNTAGVIQWYSSNGSNNADVSVLWYDTGTTGASAGGGGSATTTVLFPTSTVLQIDNANGDFAYGIIFFLIGMFGILWLFAKKR